MSLVTCIRKQDDGTHLTEIWRDEVLVYTVPTAANQIRPARESQLWSKKPKDKPLFFGKHDNVNSSSYEALEV